MKQRILNGNKYIHSHKSKEVTSPVYFIGEAQTPAPGGLFDPDIFGRTTEEKRALTGYVRLNKMYIEPIVYEAFFKRKYRAVDDIILGRKKFVIKNGELIEDEDNGGTGLEWFYDNFDKIKLKNAEEHDDDRVLSKAVKLSFNKLPKQQLFTNIATIKPLIYRDINRSSGSMALDELNTLYTKLISLNKVYSDSVNDPIIDKYRLDYNIQMTMVEILHYGADRLFGKDGVLRKKLMGRSVDYAARAVISAPTFKGAFGSSPIDLDTSGFPLSIVLGTLQPIMIFHVTQFFKNYFNTGKITGVSLEEYENIVNRKFVKDLIKTYITSWGMRVMPVHIEELNHTVSIDIRRNGVMESREITLTELLYIVAYSNIEGKYSEVISRYPIMDSYNIITSKIHVLSTTDTVKVEIAGIDYPYYPNMFDIDLDDESMLTTIFHETIKISNTLLKGFDGDYDGDKLAVRAPMSDEAIEEVNTLAKAKINVFNLEGDMVKFVGGEAIQALYSLSINPKKGNKKIAKALLQVIIDKKREDIDPGFLFKTLQLGKTTKRKVDYNSYNDTIILNKGDYPGIDEATETTLGRLIINKVIFSICDTPYVNEVMTAKVIKKVFVNARDKVIADTMELDTFKMMVKVYEDFGFRMSSYINPSLDTGVMIPSKEFTAKKESLFIKYKKELESNDLVVTEKIETELIDMAKAEYKDHPYMEWYESGSMGKMGYKNDFKVSRIMIGAIPKADDPGAYHVSTSNYIDGVKKEEMHILAGQMIVAAFARAKNTAIGGYIAKQGNAIYENTKLDKYGSDCKTTRYKTIMITEKNKDSLSGRYTSAGVCLTPNILSKNIGKVIRLRSPMMCESEYICSKCAGEMIYNLMGIKDKPINIGFFITKIFTELTQKSLQKTHVTGANLLTVTDMNKYLIKK